MGKQKIVLQTPPEKLWFFAISCAETIHKFAWNINSAMSLNLLVNQGISFNQTVFPTLIDQESIPELSIVIAKNKMENQYLIKGLESVDYILMLKGETSDADIANFTAKLKNTQTATAIIPIKTEKFKGLSLINIF